MSQLIDESAEDFIARVMKKAKYVPNIDESLLRSAVIQGLRPQIRSHVLQANIHNMADLLQAARVADVATTSSDPTFQQLLTEIRVSNEQHAKHNAAFELLSSRLNDLHVSSADTNNTSRSRSSSPVSTTLHYSAACRSLMVSAVQSWAGSPRTSLGVLSTSLHRRPALHRLQYCMVFHRVRSLGRSCLSCILQTFCNWFETMT